MVAHNVPPYTIVGGVPAKEIKKRFSDDVISKLLEVKWWNWPQEAVQKNIQNIQSGNSDKLLKVN